MRFSLRRATRADAAALTDIHLRARRECMSYLPEKHTPQEILDWVHEILLAHEEVWVAEHELHGHGAGSELFARVQELRPDGFRLWVFQRNTQAREFYEHRGMRVVELTDGSENEEREPDALYQWKP
jgi:hypothetical protein